MKPFISSFDEMKKVAKLKEALQNRLYLVVLTLLLAIIVTIIWILSVMEFRNIQQSAHEHHLQQQQNQHEDRHQNHDDQQYFFSVLPEHIHLILGCILSYYCIFFSDFFLIQ